MTERTKLNIAEVFKNASPTLGEIDLIEDCTGLSMSSVEAGFDPEQDTPEAFRQGKAARAFALVALRRKNPDATWDDTYNVEIEVPEDEAVTTGGVTSLDPPAPPADDAA